MSKEKWLEDRQRLWEQIDEDGEFCQYCQHCERTTDAYGTGDSPTLRECTAWDSSDCPGVEEQWVDGMYEGEHDELMFKLDYD